MDLQALLQTHFGYPGFRKGQREIMAHVLDGQDGLVVMPTGSGKSLCYQLPAMAMSGVTLVVSPLIALMKDQVDALRERDIPATFLNSSLSRQEYNDRMEGLKSGAFRLLYVAPERFTPSFIAFCNTLDISLLLWMRPIVSHSGGMTSGRTICGWEPSLRRSGHRRRLH